MKRFVFLLVLMLILLVSTITVLADTDSGKDFKESVTIEKAVPDILTRSGIEYYSEKYADVFFDSTKVSDELELVQINVLRDYNSDDSLRHILTGTVNQDAVSDAFADPVVMLMYIKVDGKYESLEAIDLKSDETLNVVKGNILIYSKVKLETIGKDKPNDVRLIIFQKSNVKKLVLNKNLQIVDKKIIVRNFTVLDRVRIGINDVLNIVTQPK